MTHIEKLESFLSAENTSPRLAEYNRRRSKHEVLEGIRLRVKTEIEQELKQLIGSRISSDSYQQISYLVEEKARVLLQDQGLIDTKFNTDVEIDYQSGNINILFSILES